MKKFGIVLLSLGLIIAFGASAFAADVKFTGEYYARGSYMSSASLKDHDQNTASGPVSFYDSRARFYWRIAVADGLSLTTRMDALEQMWGGSATSHADMFSFEQAYATIKTKAGTFEVGHNGYGSSKFGTKFLDSVGTYPGIKYTNNFGPVKVIADIEKMRENSTSGLGNDMDYDIYELSVEGKFSAGSAGIQVSDWRDATARNATLATDRFSRNVYIVDPYVKVKVGPVDLEAEGYWFTGDWKKYEGSSTGGATNTASPDQKVEAKGVYARATVNIGPAYVGGFFAYMSGDDPKTSDKIEGGGIGTAGPVATFKMAKDNEIFGNFTSIIFNDDYHDQLSTNGFDSNGTGKYMDNTWLFAVTGGVKVGKDMSFDARFLTAYADQVNESPNTTQDKKYGKELDLKASYNIYDNLSYNVGFAYLWTGDWYKGAASASDLASRNVTNAYYVSHWIDLNF